MAVRPTDLHILWRKTELKLRKFSLIPVYPTAFEEDYTIVESKELDIAARHCTHHGFVNRQGISIRQPEGGRAWRNPADVARNVFN